MLCLLSHVFITLLLFELSNSEFGETSLPLLTVWSNY